MTHYRIAPTTHMRQTWRVEKWVEPERRGWFRVIPGYWEDATCNYGSYEEMVKLAEHIAQPPIEFIPNAL